jgi:hypothetical protein
MEMILIILTAFSLQKIVQGFAQIMINVNFGLGEKLLMNLGRIDVTLRLEIPVRPPTHVAIPV